MSTNPLRHTLSRMGGRDPHEKHRASTPLELFFDLTFVIAFGVAGSQFAHAIAEAHVWPGLLAFAFAMFCIIWAWINFSWFASAYDTDDWVFRLVTMVQMVGVLVLAMGIEPLFHSIIEGNHVDNATMVAGYIIMRVALIFQWLRAARQDPAHRQVCLRYAAYLAIVQVGWVAVLLVDANIPTMLAMAAPLFILEVMIPYTAERKGTGTPWHAHHMAERFGLLAIIALGECLLGAIETLRAIVAIDGWSVETALVGLSGTGLAFAMWWIYFVLPSGQALHARRDRGPRFGYWHMPVFAAIAATGAGLHVAAYFIAHETHISATIAVASIAIPIAIFQISLTSLYTSLLGVDRSFVWVAAFVVAGLGAGVGMAAAGVPVSLCMLEMMIVLGLVIAFDERSSHKGRAVAIQRLESAAS
ncbi:low temperature requirement protein LtrA [Arthrobacter stackebrandtii]|uniref:Low temperature requirement protein LtrA n=1 Tax=Arthrobacter stackebrandtii TaxID=272161 RepID=A0ABS4YUY8_9MICC|nr:low temperature requirement protein A [Arthrobacter stackebrandtii]MBP2412615.1 low temperature requirement protein LtrA [Arthrobacter stackebrandtii]PYG98672.1 hypothetical protein CVV67_19430 [Arthrobacter stackebrandtii]